jgi:hypothetical protein
VDQSADHRPNLSDAEFRARRRRLHGPETGVEVLHFGCFPDV